MRTSPRRLIAAVVGAVVLASCNADPMGPASLQGVGRIPGVHASAGAIIVDGVRADLAPSSGPRVGSTAAGNRLLVIGDSILAGSASRYGGAMCGAMVPLGWRVAVEAEAGRPVAFGRTVLNDRLREGWDIAVVFLGTNYGGDKARYQDDLTRIVQTIAPRPVLLLTATLFRDTMVQVNDAIRVVASQNPNVTVLDWGSVSTQQGLLNKDGIHPTDTGRRVLVASVAAAVGPAPAGQQPAACLPSKYTDDSMGRDVMPTTVAPGETIVYDTVPVATTVPAHTSSSTSSSTSSTIAGATTSTVRQ